MTKAELIKSLAELSGETKATVTNVLDQLEALTQGELAEGNEITLPGIGKLKPQVKPAHKGRNPATGETIEVPEKTVVKFSAAAALKDAIA